MRTASSRCNCLFALSVLMSWLMPTVSAAQVFDGLDITIRTGRDDAGPGTGITARLAGGRQFLCLKPSSLPLGEPQDSACRGSPLTNWWHTNHFFRATFVTWLGPTLESRNPGTIEIVLAQRRCYYNCDNWDLQSIVIDLVNGSSALPAMHLLNLQGGPSDDTCVARLKAPPNATRVRFALNGTNGHNYTDGYARGLGSTCKN